jgi:hypothetical protein
MVTMTRTFVAASEYAGVRIEIRRWTEPPTMDVGAPEPSFVRVEDDLFVAFVCGNPEFPGWDAEVSPDHPGFEVYSCLLRFDDVSDVYVGPPNDESLHLHPLYRNGLKPYDFVEVLNSPRAQSGLRHWILTFHGETLEVLARSAVVVNRRIFGENTSEIVKAAARADS